MAICENHGHPPRLNAREFLLNFLDYYEFVDNETCGQIAILIYDCGLCALAQPWRKIRPHIYCRSVQTRGGTLIVICQTGSPHIPPVCCRTTTL